MRNAPLPILSKLQRWVLRCFTLAINERFAEEGIDIPFPQRVLHLRSVDPSATLADVAADKT
jgi:small-conductance mechanosensitive channel